MSAITAGPERDAREPRRIAEVNLIGTLNVLEESKNVRSESVSCTPAPGRSTAPPASGVPEPLDEERHRPVPESMYGITKYAAERSCLRLAALWGLDVRIGRLAQVFGRWEHASGVRDRLSMPTEIARIARAGGEAVFPPLGDTDYIYAPDVARALIALLDAKTSSHRLYHLGTGTAWALPAWCELLQKRFPEFRWRESSEGANVVPLSPGTRTRFSNRRLAEDLGWAPRFDLAAAADDFIAWLEANERRGAEPPRAPAVVPRRRGRPGSSLQAAFRRASCRFLPSRSSTSATISSSVSDCSPCWRAIRRTRQSTRSMCSAPPNSARAADEGLPRPSAALAYFSNGTRSSSSAPRPCTELPHPVVDLARLVDVRRAPPP